MDHEQAVQNLAVECYLLGEMTPAEREGFEEHYFECPVCANDLRAASLFLEDAKHIWATQPRPVMESALVPQAARAAAAEPKASFWSWLDWLRPQIAAPAMAALILAVGFSLSRNASLNAELERATSPRAVSYKVLRELTRGESPKVTASPGDAVVLQFYLTDIPSQELQFIVKSIDDSEKLRLTGTAPAPGDPVTLSIPRFDLAPGQYTLLVETSSAFGRAGSEIARYPLEVRRP